MCRHEPPGDAHVLRTRIPRGRIVAGLTYGRYIGVPGWNGCYVRPEGGVTWGVARLVPTADACGDDAAIVAAIRAELEAALPDGVRTALRLLQADPALVANARGARGDTLVGALLARPVGPMGSRRAAESAVAAAVRILDGEEVAARGQALPPL